VENCRQNPKDALALVLPELDDLHGERARANVVSSAWSPSERETGRETDAQSGLPASLAAPLRNR
jgi:hypothetical protein